MKRFFLLSSLACSSSPTFAGSGEPFSYFSPDNFSLLVLLGLILILTITLIWSNRKNHLTGSVTQQDLELTKLSEIIENTPQLVASTTPDGTLIYLNSAGRILLNIPSYLAIQDLSIHDFQTDLAIHFLDEVAIPIALKNGSWEGVTTVIPYESAPISVKTVLIAHRNRLDKLQRLSCIMEDISHTQKAEEELRRINTQIDAALTLAKAGHWHIPLNGSGTFFASPQTIDILGLSPNHDGWYHLEHDWISGIKKADPTVAKTMVSVWQQLFRGELMRDDLEYPFKRPNDGTIVWVHTLGELVCDSAGKPTDIYGVTRNVTAEKKLEHDLVLAKEQAETASATKSEFLANMSHEIRTPMNVIIGMTHILENTPLSPVQKNYVTKVSKAARALLHIINDILDFSKVEAGKLTIELVEFNIEEVLQNIVDVIGEQVADKPIELHLHIDPAIPQELVGDSLRLSQIITNLLSNAIKFTEKGDITVATSIVKQNAETITLKFSIIDTGIGIPKEQLDHLFQSFTQADATTTRKYGGTGLGLAIARRLCTLLGGTISVKSTVGEGSTFEVQLPFGCSPLTQIPLITPTKTPKDSAVLLIEDNPIDQKIIKELLILLGFSVEVVSSASKARKALRMGSNTAQPYAFVLLDTTLPQMSGDSIYEEFSTLIPPSTPLIRMVSGLGNLRKDLFEESETHRLYKPIKPRTIEHLVNQIMAPSYRSLPHRQEQPTPTLYLPEAKVLVAEDHPINQEIICSLLEEAGIVPLVVESGAKALQAVSENQFDLILMDLQMPDMDGLTATINIRKLPNNKGKSIPIIAMTARAMKEDKERCFQAGMTDYLAKPLDPDKVMTLLRRHLTTNKKEGKKVTPQQKIAPLIPQVPGINRTIGLRYVNDNVELYSKLLEVFAEEFSTVESHLSSTHFLDDMDTTIRMIHSTKGVAGSLGALQLQTISAHFEQTLRENHIHDFEMEKELFLSTYKEIAEAIVAKNPSASSIKKREKSLGTHEEYLLLIRQLLEALTRNEPRPSKQIIQDLLHKEWTEVSSEELHHLEHLISKYQFNEALVAVQALVS